MKNDKKTKVMKTEELKAIKGILNAMSNDEAVEYLKEYANEVNLPKVVGEKSRDEYLCTMESETNTYGDQNGLTLDEKKRFAEGFWYGVNGYDSYLKIKSKPLKNR